MTDDGRLLVLLGLVGVAGASAVRRRGATAIGQHVEIVLGSLPIIVSVPHGGSLRQSEIPDREGCTDLPVGPGEDGRACTSTTDPDTIELARAISSAFEGETGRRPHLVICHLHRAKVDANREIGEATQGHPGAALAWRAYHDGIGAAARDVVARYGSGLYIDLHAHGHPSSRVEMGYGLSGKDLRCSDATISGFAERSTLRHVMKRTRASFAEVLRGRTSLGGRIGLPAVPSPATPAPEGADYYGDGYSVLRYAATLPSVQIETPLETRSSVSTRRTTGERVTDAALAFLRDHLGVTP
jgi:hypothetical protein